MSTFAFTRDSSDLAIRAANAYDNIISALDTANEAALSANNAANTTYNEINPDDDDRSLIKQAQSSINESKALKQEADSLGVDGEAASMWFPVELSSSLQNWTTRGNHTNRDWRSSTITCSTLRRH